ncbi:hypothetical protein SAMN05216333_1674, partial [Nitrosomonas oligotropha]
MQHILLNCITGLVMAPVDSFLFEATKKAFCYGIVEAIAGAADTTEASGIPYWHIVPIRMHNQSCLWLAPPDRH